MNKVNLESGAEPGSSRPELVVEKDYKQRAGTGRSGEGLGDCKFSLIWEMQRGHISTSSLICQVFTPISDSQVLSGNGTTELDTASLEDV